MSCVLKDVAIIHGLSDITYWLCPHLNNTGVEEVKSEIENEDKSEEPPPPEWLDECILSLSPMLDIMAIGSKNRLAIFTSHWERNEQGEKKLLFSVSSKGVVSNGNERDEITSIVCLPIISQKQSSSGAPDWTSVIVGLKSGFISFYTEGFMPLLRQIFEEKPVHDIKVRTYVPKNFGACLYSDLSEELVILYPKCIVSIDGFALLQTLKACRNQAAKAAAGGVDCPVIATLGYKKWSLAEQEEVTGCVASGMVPPHLYDYIMFMYSMRGFSQSLAGGVPTTTLILTVGRSPYFTSYSIREGIAQPFMADIAMHYASKLKHALVSAASGWLFGSRQNVEGLKKDKKIETPVPIPFRYALPDRRRAGLSIQLAMSRRLASVTDDFGRVNVIDVQKCLVLRMFKGYRDAECGWVTVSGEIDNAQREVPFLVIHAPRRSLLEVWLPQQGPRIAAFNLPKGSRLIYTSHTLLGAHTQEGRVFPTTPVVLVNPQGTLERLSIPFHLALSGKTSKQAKDLHLLKTLKTALRSKPADQVLSVVKEIKTNAIKLQVVTTMIGCKQLTVELASDVLSELGSYEKKEESMDWEEPEYIDHDTRALHLQLTVMSQLLKFYLFLSALHSHQPSPGADEEDIKRRLSLYLKLTDGEVDRIRYHFKDDRLQPQLRKKVTFSEDAMTLSSFLQCWNVDATVTNNKKMDAILLTLKKNIEDFQLNSLGNFIFGWNYDVDHRREFCQNVKSANLDEAEMIHLLFVHWFSLDDIDERRLLHFFEQLLLLALLHQPRLSSLSLSDVNPMWEKAREKLIGWTKPLHACAASYVCKGVESSLLSHSAQLGKEFNEVSGTMKPTFDLEKVFHALDAPSKVDVTFQECESWEEFSMEMVEWNLLQKKLEKLVLVQKFYNVVMKNLDSHSLPALPEYSVKVFTMKGKGYLSELIARWFIESKLPVEDITEVVNKMNKDEEIELKKEDEIEENMDVTEDKSEEMESCENNHNAQVIDELNSLKKHFPESTKADVLLVNLAWEFAATWKKDPNRLEFYDACLRSLENIQNAFFKHGVSCMMWETWVVHYVQSTAQLMEKVSRRPKDRLVMREVGISEFNLERFFSLTKKLLEILMAGNMGCEVERPPIVSKDCFWKEVECSPSLAEVTVAQKLTSCDLAFLHYQLISVLCLIVRYELKNVKPFSLFPERDRAAFFKPLISSWRLTSEEGKEVISSSQLSFLSRVVSAAVRSLPDAELAETPSGLQDSLEIGRNWGVSLDALRRHYVCELYSSGMDSLAEQALILVRDGVMIGSQMVVIAGQRLRYLITSSPKALETTALVTPNVKEWCMALELGNLRCPDVSVKRTLKMVNKALMLIPESSREHKIASNLSRSLDMICNSSLFQPM